MTTPSPIPGYSKAPQGLFVLPQVVRVFTDTAISPSPPPRQWPSRSTIHAGRNLPDKGLRYLRHVVAPPLVRKGTAISAALCTSPCRSDHILSPVPLGESGVWSLRIPGKRFAARVARLSAASPTLIPGASAAHSCGTSRSGHLVLSLFGSRANPASGLTRSPTWPFLLVVRTGRVVTPTVSG
jgi:hypothetical protein